MLTVANQEWGFINKSFRINSIIILPKKQKSGEGCTSYYFFILKSPIMELKPQNKHIKNRNTHAAF